MDDKIKEFDFETEIQNLCIDQEPHKSTVKVNRYMRKRITKKKIEKLIGTKWWPVSTHKDFPQRNYLSNRKTFAKRCSNKKVRRYNDNINNGGQYRKIYEYDWEVF